MLKDDMSMSSLLRFKFQTRLPGCVHGIKFDLDSTRLIGIMTSSSTARIRMLQPWQCLGTLRVAWKMAYEMPIEFEYTEHIQYIM